MNNTLKNRLQYHVTGAIERGESQAIVEIPALHTIEIQDRIDEIKEALQALCLGSIEHVVIEAAVNELIQNWEDHK
jgi:hypothetical protein